mgnify:CR=1 FL=1
MKTVVLVDDSEQILEYLIEVFKSYKTHELLVKAFLDPLTALQFMQRHNADLIITDFQMPDFNGIELAQGIKISISQKIPIFLHTGDSREFPSGLFDKVFRKPTHQKDFFKALDDFL